MPKEEKNILIGISSGIAGYKIVDLINILKKRDYQIKVILTTNAVKMFGREMFEKALGEKVMTDLFPVNFDYKKILRSRSVEHVELTDTASMVVIAPATANIIAKLAQGFADDLLTTTILASRTLVLICPSMNPHMWNNSFVQENVSRLSKAGFIILKPVSGTLACGYEGVGRLPEPMVIAKEIEKILLNKNKLKGKKIIITAGGTKEKIDAVRVIANRASGKMGLALAEECFERGANVLLIRSADSVRSNYPIQEKVFESTKELEKIIKENILQFDVLFHTAAVSDYTPEKSFNRKLDSSNPFTLKLRPTEKILPRIKKWNPKILLIGFKAVYKKREKEASVLGRDKLLTSRSDFIIVNDISRQDIGFGANDNEVIVISKEGHDQKIMRASKKEIAGKILDRIL